MKERFFLNLEASTGRFFEYSKVAKDGFTKVENVNPKTKATSVSYRRYFERGVFGNLVSLSKREREMGTAKVMEMSIVLDNPEENAIYYCNFPLFTQKGSINDYSMSVIRVIGSLEKDKAYCFRPFAIDNEYNGKVRKNYGVSVYVARLSDNAIDDVNRPTQLTFKRISKDGTVTNGDIPMIDWSEDFKGAPIADSKKRDKYLWDVLEANSIEYVSSGSGMKTFDSTTQGDEPKADIQPNTNFDTPKVDNSVKDVPPITQEEDDDELPF